MDRTETISEFKEFLTNNREKLLDFVVPIEELSEDNEWLQDNEWDDIYMQEVIKNEKI